MRDNIANSQSSNSSATTLALAQQFFLTGRFEEATTVGRKYLETNPNDPDAWQLIGLIAFKAERFEAAEKMIQRAISVDGSKASYFINLGTL